MSFARQQLMRTLELLMICLLGTTLAFSQARPANPAADKPLMSEEAFKNVQVLRGIPAKEFMETMGFFAASLSLTCSDCHSEASGSSWEHYADDIPRKQMARKMVVMVNSINAANFGGERKVTCYTCHRTAVRPKIVPSLAAQYAVPSDEDPDEVEPQPNARAGATPDQILDKYIQALGGAAAVAKLTSYTAKGTYVGFDSDFGEVPIDVYAKAPDMRATVVHMHSGQNINTYDGREAWAAGAPDLVPIPLLPLLGQHLLAARLDAQLAFPSQVKQVLTNWQGGYPEVTIDGRDVQVIGGKMADGTIAKLYFDKQTGLLVRQVRYIDTAVGRVTTHVIYSDYRAVNGVKMPFQWEVTWVDGQATIKLTSLQANAPVNANVFAKPAAQTSAAR
jgi:photosynthetic reaction center cytochrome c subunit